MKVGVRRTKERVVVSNSRDEGKVPTAITDHNHKETVTSLNSRAGEEQQAGKSLEFLLTSSKWK